MSFDIYQLDKLDSGDALDEKAFYQYQNAIVELFLQSAEMETYLQQSPEADPGFWTAQLMYYGYNYIGVALPNMTVDHVEEIVTELFPRKISLQKPEDADEAIPELIVFWQYLKREYKLHQADAVLKLLKKIAPRFRIMMNDPANFGMAKSFFMMGQSAGFDMTDETEASKFMLMYNAAILAEETPDRLFGASAEKKQTADPKKKKKRKTAKATRKKNRRN
ncbi:MAG: hypothetical protein JXB30_14750 [Anaerolineae bacterium]|nr:hypothetical protein [Anaerolineae bacterium]